MTTEIASRDQARPTKDPFGRAIMLWPCRSAERLFDPLLFQANAMPCSPPRWVQHESEAILS